MAEFGYRPDGYIDTHPKKVTKPKSLVKPGTSPMVELKQLLKEVENEKEMLSAELGFTQKELEEDIKKIAALERDIGKLTLALKAAHEAQDELEKERTLLKAEIERLLRLIDTMNAEKTDLLQQISSHLARISSLEAALSDSQARVAELTKTGELERTSSVARFDDLNRSSAATIKNQQAEIGSLTIERDGLKSRVSTLEEQVSNLTRSETELTRLNHQYQLQLQVVKRETQRAEGAAHSKKQREMEAAEQIEMSKLRLTAAVNGTFVDKYCRNGKVHSVHMRISPDRKEIMWKDVASTMSTERRFMLDDITHIVRGQVTPVFRKNATTDIPAELSDRSFSLITPARSVDVVATTADVCDLWLKALTSLLPLQVETTLD